MPARAFGGRGMALQQRFADDVIGGVGASGSPGVDEPCVMAGPTRCGSRLQ